MIIAIDIETQGLDATKYLLGCLIKEGKKKPEIYNTPQKLWQRVLELGIKEAKRNKVLNVYSHHAQYDTASYIDLTDKHLHFYSNRPFIWSYKLTKQELKQHNIEPPTKTKIFNNTHDFNTWQQQNHFYEIKTVTPHNNTIEVTYYQTSKEIIKFLDSNAIFHAPLKTVGELINLPKLDTPDFLKNTEHKLTPFELGTITPYLIRDTEICLQGIQHIKNKLKEDNINIKRLYTVQQIAINYFLQQLKKTPQSEHLFYNQHKGQFYRTYRSKDIHEAYRGGRVEAFQLGEIPHVTYIDVNSLYPHSLKVIPTPDMKTERKIYNPLSKHTPTELLNTLGISKVILTNDSNILGLLPIRTDTGNYYPKPNTTIIGTYTHLELQKAIKDGYTLHDIEWSITYDTKHNPFKTIVDTLYAKRQQGTPFDKNFYKLMLNCAIGKMAQTRTMQEITIDSVEKAEQYLKQNYEIIKGIDLNYMYKKPLITNTYKPYYLPIIPTLVTAHARLTMYEHFKKIPQTDLIYTDTDSIIFTGQHQNKFNYSNNMGDFKLVEQNAPAIIYGRKSYVIGNEAKISGFTQRNTTFEEMKKGLITTQKQITINTTQDTSKVGTFTSQTRNLHEQTRNYKQINKLYDSQTLFIDNNQTNINYFLPIIHSITNQ